MTQLNLNTSRTEFTTGCYKITVSTLKVILNQLREKFTQLKLTEDAIALNGSNQSVHADINDNFLSKLKKSIRKGIVTSENVKIRKIWKNIPLT